MFTYKICLLFVVGKFVSCMDIMACLSYYFLYYFIDFLCKKYQKK